MKTLIKPSWIKGGWIDWRRVRFHTIPAAGLATLVSLISPPALGQAFVASPALGKFVQDLRGVGPGGIPVAMPDGVRKWPHGGTANHYTIDINQFADTLHPDLPPTTLWGYNPRNALGVTGVPVQKHLGGIIVAERGQPVQITFVNNLPPNHILPVDTTLMGADGPQNRTSTHLHGGFVPWVSDGGPFATWDPLGNHGPSFINNTVLRPGQNVPANQADVYYPNDQSARLMWYHDHAIGITRLNAYAGIASGYIIRDDFERHILVKKLGLPAFVENGGRELPLIIQDKVFEPEDNDDFPGSARTAGSLWYPYTYDPLVWERGPGMPLPVVSVVPEMFGDTLLVNGTVYPKISVDPRHYRWRILNACQARFLNLQLYEADANGQPDLSKPGPDFIVIGTEGGFLARPVRVPSAPLQVSVDAVTGERSVDPAMPGGSLLTAPAERWDVVVDFNGLSGKSYILCNDAPAPYPCGDARNDYMNATHSGNSEVLMRLDVKPDQGIAPDPRFAIYAPVGDFFDGYGYADGSGGSWGTPLASDRRSAIDPPLAGPDPDAPVAKLHWADTPPLPLPVPTRQGIVVRQLTLNEGFDPYGRLIQKLGTNVATAPGDFSRAYADPMDPNAAPTEKPKAGATEVWQIANLTGDVHPIHIHLVNAQLLSRRPFDMGSYLATPVGAAAKPIYIGAPRGPDPTEVGWKETIKMNPGEITTIIMKIDLPKTPFVVPPSPRTGGFEYVWHCHILDHEEHDMMRPMIVMP